MAKKKPSALSQEIEGPTKISQSINFKHRPFKLTEKQKSLLEIMLKDETKIVFVAGPAGVGKTHQAVMAALTILTKNKDSQIMYVRSIAESAEKGMGSLPGEAEDKFCPFTAPLYDKIEELISPEHVTWLRKSNSVVAMPINYLRGASWRDKIVIADECFEDSAFLETNKGRIRLARILESPEKYQVLSLNESTGEFEFKRVLNTFKKGKKSISEMVLDGRSKIRSTKDHRYLTVDGWKRMEDIQIGDGIISSSSGAHAKIQLNEDQYDMMIGSIIGDGGFDEVNPNSFRFKCLHGIKQQDYLAFKANLFQRKTKIIEKNGYAQTQAIVFCSKSFYLKSTKADLKKLSIENLNLKSLAISWQDDGYYDPKGKMGMFWSCAEKKEESLLLAEKLKLMGYDCDSLEEKKIRNGAVKTYYKIRLRVSEFKKMAKDIAPYVHPSMAYKIPQEFHDLVGTYEWNNQFKMTSVRVVTKVNFDVCENEVYDIEVEDNHNFVVSLIGGGDGTKIVAHNCQNFSHKELVTLITRIGEGTKVFICGDFMQADIKNSGFESMFNLFSTPDCAEQGIHTFKFGTEDIVRSGILRFIVEKLEEEQKRKRAQ